MFGRLVVLVDQSLWFVASIEQKLLNGFLRKLVEGWEMGQRRG